MGAVLTENSSVACSNRGAVSLRAGQSKLTVNGSKVLVDGDLSSASTISSSCTTESDPNTSTLKCATILTVTGGVAGKLKVEGKGVLLESIHGTTSGKVAGTAQSWSVQSAGQTKLNTE
jgi:hypothetical protein